MGKSTSDSTHGRWGHGTWFGHDEEVSARCVRGLGHDEAYIVVRGVDRGR